MATDEQLAAQIDIETQILARIREKNTTPMKEANSILYHAEMTTRLRLQVLNAILGVAVPLPEGSLPTYVLQIGDSIGYGEKAGPWAAITHLGYAPGTITINNTYSIGGHTMAQIPGELPDGMDPFYDASKRCVVIIQRGDAAAIWLNRWGGLVFRVKARTSPPPFSRSSR